MERLINEILVGRRVITTECDYAPIIVCRGLTGEEKLFSHLEYEKSLADAIDVGLKTEEQITKEIYKNGDWSIRQDNKVKELEVLMKDMKSDLAESKYNVSRKKSVEKQLKLTQDKYNELRYFKQSLLGNSAESFALEHKYIWNIHKMVYRPNGTAIWDSFGHLGETDKDIVSTIVRSYIHGFNVDTEEIRKLARSGIWRIYYNRCNNAKDLFNRPPCDFDDNQINILYWSSLYDSVFQMSDPPSEDILDNNVEFDAWLDNYNKEQKRKRTEDSFAKGSVKGNSREEIYVVTDDEGADKLYKELGAPKIDPNK